MTAKLPKALSDSTPEIFGALIQEVIGVMTGAIPGQATAGAIGASALRSLITKRLRLAADTLQKELATGRIAVFDVTAQDDVAAILFGYLRAAQECAGRWNLRLMSQVIRHQVEGGNLIADEFRYYADIVGNLKRHEVILLGTLIRVERELRNGGAELHDGEVLANLIWNQVGSELLATELFKSRSEMLGVAYGLLRTGVMRIGETWDESALPKPTPLLSNVAEWCDFEAALIDEPATDA